MSETIRKYWRGKVVVSTEVEPFESTWKHVISQGLVVDCPKMEREERRREGKRGEGYVKLFCEAEVGEGGRWRMRERKRESAHFEMSR